MAPRKAKQPSVLSTALDHCIVATRLDNDYGKHCVIANRTVTQFDGVVAAGHTVVDHIQCAPRTETLRAALQRVGEPYSLTVLGDGSLVVSGARLRVVVPCVDAGTIPGAAPDRPAYAVSPLLTSALQLAGSVALEKAEQTCLASVLLCSGACYGTDGRIVIKALHDVQFNGYWQVPKEFLVAAKKVQHAVTHFGFSDNSITLWFGADKWLRSQLFPFSYPDCESRIQQAFRSCTSILPVNQELPYALENLKPFLKDASAIWLVPGQVRTSLDANGDSFSLDHGLPGGKYSYAGIRVAALYGQQIGFFEQGFAFNSPHCSGFVTAIV